MFIKELINARIRQLTSNDLMKYSENYGFSLTEDEANQIIFYYHKNNINPFNDEERMQFFRQLSEITDHKTSQKAHELFIKIIEQNNLSHLFD